MPLGTEVGLGRGHIVLDGDPAPPRKWAQQYSPPPLFGPCLLLFFKLLYLCVLLFCATCLVNKDVYILWPNGRPSQQLLS